MSKGEAYYDSHSFNDRWTSRGKSGSTQDTVLFIRLSFNVRDIERSIQTQE